MTINEIFQGMGIRTMERPEPKLTTERPFDMENDSNAQDIQTIAKSFSIGPWIHGGQAAIAPAPEKKKAITTKNRKVIERLKKGR